MEFAKEGRSRGKVTNPAVIGAVIDLGFCLDLISSTGIEAVKAAHEDFIAVHASRGKVVRAEPIAAMYEQRKVHHVGACSIRAASQSYGFRALTGVASNRQANYAATR